VRVRCVPDTKSRAPLAAARTLLSSVLRGLPLVVRHNWNPLLARAVREEWEGGGHARLHLNHLDTVQYVRRGELGRAVIDTHNLLFEYYARVAARDRDPLSKLLHSREARLLRGYERAAFAAAERVLVCSETERDTLRALEPSIDARVVPNGADCEHFRPSERDPWENPPVLAFVGDMAYGPNDDAARFFAGEVMPLLRARVPGVRFTAVGKNPSPALRALAAAHEDVEATGFVEDVREHVWRARACVVPIRYGAGTRLKVLEAFAMGMPTVSTAIGAEGIDYEDGGDILIADSAEELAAAAARVLGERELHRELRERARRKALERYDWRVIGERLLACYPGASDPAAP
jgi:glycosyltransferase involved in cell wall biosynthesis